MSFIPSVNEALPGDPIRAKWLFDGCTSLAEASEAALKASLHLQALHDAGWTLEEAIQDDYGTLVSPDGDSGNDELFDDLEVLEKFSQTPHLTVTGETAELIGSLGSFEEPETSDTVKALEALDALDSLDALESPVENLGEYGAR